ncbi:MAG TPA: hypothetical protein VLB07_03480 [Woeseiaceae bacterium]|nr:hypothetical protein [Woeseiaceae bacterium]
MTKSKAMSLTVAACATGLLYLAASAAIAGEITGNGKSLKNEDGTLNGNSACAFSGRQDNYEEDEGLFRSMITQNWGQLFKELKAIFPHPGTACNPTKSAGEP